MNWLLRRFRRDDEGATAMEFSLLMPIFFAIVFGFYDMGAVMLRQVMLNSAVDLVSRELRIAGTLDSSIAPTDINGQIQEFRARVCGRSYMLNDCLNDLVIDMRPIPVGAPLPPRNAPCVNRGPGGTTQPVTTYNQNVTTLPVYVRVCAPSMAMIRNMGIGPFLENANGDVMIYADTAFLFEI